MKIKELYDPIVSSGVVNGFIRAIDTTRAFDSLWFEELGSMGRIALDNFILLKIGNKTVLPIIEELETVDRMRFMSDILRTYNYQLDGLWRLLIPNDSSESGYNPLDNVNEVRRETTEHSFDKGEQTDTVSMDDRKNTTKNPTFTDTTTTSGKDSPFDSTDYDKANEKQTTTNEHGAHDIISTMDSTSDETKSGSRHDEESTEYNVKRHGNIGVTTSFDLISGDRRVHYYNFFNEVVNVIIHEMTILLWEV